MYKVFINDAPIILTDSLNPQNNFPVLVYGNIVLEEIFHKIESGFYNGVSLYCFDLQKCWDDFRSHCEIKVAAGGLVANSKNEYLFIFRGEKWDFPKGGVENNESLEETAIREVKEECNISHLTLERFLITTHHIFYQHKIRILKETHWFLMHSEDIKKPIPQIEEGITIAEYKSISDARLALKESYANIRLVFNLLNT